jgi:preprotein translocase subunit SecD
LASVGGAIPADEEMLHGFGTGSVPDSVYVLQRASIVSGTDFRAADPSTNPYSGQSEVQFTLTHEAGDRFYDYTSKNINHYIAVVMGGRIREAAAIKSAIRDRGVIEGSFTRDEVVALSRLLRADALGKRHVENYGTLTGAGASITQIHCSVSADDGFDLLGWITR